MYEGISFWTIVRSSSAGHQQTSDVVRGFVRLTINFSWRGNVQSEYEGDDMRKENGIYLLRNSEIVSIGKIASGTKMNMLNLAGS